MFAGYTFIPTNILQCHHIFVVSTFSLSAQTIIVNSESMSHSLFASKMLPRLRAISREVCIAIGGGPDNQTPADAAVVFTMALLNLNLPLWLLLQLGPECLYVVKELHALPRVQYIRHVAEWLGRFDDVPAVNRELQYDLSYRQNYIIASIDKAIVQHRMLATGVNADGSTLDLTPVPRMLFYPTQVKQEWAAVFK